MGEWLRSLWQAVRYGGRMLRRSPGFALAAVVTLALGIGGNTAIFTVTSALLLKPLPFHNPQELVGIDLQRKGNGGTSSSGFSLNRYEQIRDRNHSFSGLAVAAEDTLNLTGHGEPVQVPVARVSPNFFTALGVIPELGRSFSDEEGRPEGKPVVMISDSLWHTRFGGDQKIIGQTINLDSAPYSIIGVVPPGIQAPFIPPADVWSPRYFELTLLTPQHIRAGVGYLKTVARLKPGVSIQSAGAEMTVLNQQYFKENPKAPDSGVNVDIVVDNLQKLTVGDLRKQLFFLSLAVGAVLLIGCLNIASLLLSRALARRKEMAVRAALGARRGLLVRQLLTESVLLALIAGLLGLGLSFVATRSLSLWSAGNLPHDTPIRMDAGVLLFALLVSLVTGVFFGIFPALQLSRTNVNVTLRDEGRGSTESQRRAQLTSLLLVIQVSFSLLLLIFAGLLVRSFTHLLSIDPGFDPRNVLSMNISLPTVKYADGPKQIAFFDELLRRVSTLPGVRSVAISAALPLKFVRITPILPEGQPEVPLAERPFIIIEATSPRLLETMRIPLLRGRTFADADNAQGPRVIIINETLARRYWPNDNPVGRHIVVGRQPPSEIVGVAGDARNSGLAQDTQPQIYLPFAQLPWASMNILVRTATDPHSMISSVRAQVTALDADQPVTDVQTIDELMDTFRAQPRFIMLLLTGFSATALVLAVVGIYGVLAYSVAQRRQELGIRLALGAEKLDILRLVVGQGLGLTAIGIAIGLVAAFALTHLMASFVYQVNVYDPATFVLAPIVFMAIGLLASYLPARRATQVDPTEALRNG
ncbi:MAG TPA: ABC transporter permease [Candidatus Angelobacter sp.]|nr:ABC transporter permease [Candidatus Angelobacter sp.]